MDCLQMKQKMNLAFVKFWARCEPEPLGETERAKGQTWGFARDHAHLQGKESVHTFNPCCSGITFRKVITFSPRPMLASLQGAAPSHIQCAKTSNKFVDLGAGAYLQSNCAEEVGVGKHC
jgi:hypothetical protein